MGHSVKRQGLFVIRYWLSVIEGQAEMNNLHTESPLRTKTLPQAILHFQFRPEIENDKPKKTILKILLILSGICSLNIEICLSFDACYLRFQPVAPFAA